MLEIKDLQNESFAAVKTYGFHMPRNEVSRALRLSKIKRFQVTKLSFCLLRSVNELTC